MYVTGLVGERERRREVARRREARRPRELRERRCRTASGQDRDALVVPAKAGVGHAQYLPAALGREADVTAVHQLVRRAEVRSRDGDVDRLGTACRHHDARRAERDRPSRAAPLVVADGVNVLPNVDSAA